MPKIKAVNHFNQNFPVLRCPKTNSAGFTPPACKPKAYGLEGIDHFLSPTPCMKLQLKANRRTAEYRMSKDGIALRAVGSELYEPEASLSHFL